MKEKVLLLSTNHYNYTTIEFWLSAPRFLKLWLMKLFCVLFSICGLRLPFIESRLFNALKILQVMGGCFFYKDTSTWAPKNWWQLYLQTDRYSYSHGHCGNKKHHCPGKLQRLFVSCLSNGICILSCFNVWVIYNSWLLSSFKHPYQAPCYCERIWSAGLIFYTIRQ